MKELKKIGKKIRDLRKAANMSQEALAFEAGLDRSYLSEIENGKKNLSITVLLHLATALNTPARDLLDF